MLSHNTRTIDKQQVNDWSNQIIGAAIETHRHIGGPGLLEKVYEEAFAVELSLAGFKVQRQLYLPVIYKGHALESPLVLDILVNDAIIIECKAAEKYNPLFEAQLFTYLRVAQKRLGLVINFGQKYMRDGIHRVVNGL